MQETKGRFKFFNFQTRKHEFTNEVLQVSATDLKNARECQYRVVLKMEGHKAPKNHYLAMGSCLHAVIEDYLLHKAKTGGHKTWNEVLSVFERLWIKETQGVVFIKTTPQEAKIKCLGMIQTYYTKALPTMFPQKGACFRPKDSIERFFKIKITHNGVKLGFTGKCDLIDRSLWVVDHKSSSKPWSQSEADDEIQAQLYPFCLKQLGVDVQGFKFMVVCKDTVTPFPVVYDEDRVSFILEEAFKLKDDIENNRLKMADNASVCKWCEFNDGTCEKSLCPNDVEI